MPEMKINSRFLLRDGEATRVYISSVTGDYTAFEREIEGNHLSTPDLDLAELVMQAVYKDTFQKYAMSDAIKQADQTAEQVHKLSELIQKSNATIETQSTQLSESNKLMQTVKESILEQANNNANLLDHTDLLDFQLKAVAKHLNITLPAELPEEEEEAEEKHEEGDEHHVVEGS